MKRSQRSSWQCNDCGTISTKWAGQCYHCKAWGSLQEKPLAEPELPPANSSSRIWSLQEVARVPLPRISTGMEEIDRLLGGGIVPGSLILLGGEPGIGKSTLLLQVSARVCESLPGKPAKVLYVSGEESIPQISMRAARLGIATPHLALLSETHLGTILHHIQEQQPALVIIDSIQITYKEEIPSAAGSVVQVRECTAAFLHLAKALSIPILLIGHVTKSGEIAGPRVLEHMVDTVLYFESDLQAGIRTLRGIKNRFGPTDELAILQMTEKGLVEVNNPSSLFLHHQHRTAPGCAVVATLEGSQPLLVEVQALVTRSFYPQPTRRATGCDPNRLALLLAVVEKKLGVALHTHDVFISIAGGLKIADPGLDLGIVAATISSFYDRCIHHQIGMMAEVGLSGDVRPVMRCEARIKELAHMGFKRCITAHGSYSPASIEITAAANLREALSGLGLLPHSS